MEATEHPDPEIAASAANILKQNAEIITKLRRGLARVRAGVAESDTSQCGWNWAGDATMANEHYLVQMRDDGDFTEKMHGFQAELAELRDDFRDLM